MAKSLSDRVRASRYQDEYSSEFVSRWDELIDWEKRYAAEAGFFKSKLEEHGAKSVLDIACGTGFHAITLALDGFDVIGSDGAPTMLAQARRNADRVGLADLELVRAEWTSLTEAFPTNSFDAVVCLGNAFTHLFEESDRIKALGEIYSVLKDDGVAIIDQRNYDSILDQGFNSKHRYYYTGSTVEVEPEFVTEEAVKFLYKYEDGAVHDLTLCPIRQDYVTALLQYTGFSSVERFGDFEPDYDFYEPDFVVQIARK
ncbi:MAG TPA: class I SAM-dependent methyltransferase [Dehalococcoidia bacterium]|nr:class I SAM-dependent methyltransferase [Dehalococcoidia bacterium]